MPKTQQSEGSPATERDVEEGAGTGSPTMMSLGGMTPMSIAGGSKAKKRNKKRVSDLAAHFCQVTGVAFFLIACFASFVFVFEFKNTPSRSGHAQYKHNTQYSPANLLAKAHECVARRVRVDRAHDVPSQQVARSAACHSHTAPCARTYPPVPTRTRARRYEKVLTAKIDQDNAEIDKVENTLNRLDVEIAKEESSPEIDATTLDNINKLDDLAVKLQGVEHDIEADVDETMDMKAKVIRDESKLEQEVAEEEQAGGAA